MEIYVVQFGDDIESIANRYGISVERLISDNGLTNPNKLAVGQTLVILYPKEIYTIKPGDTLEAIAEQNGISLMQLIRNNPFLYDREYLYQDETLVISYNTIRDIQTNGYIDTAVSQDILSKVLPYLTYISIYDYRIVDDNFGLISDFDDTTIIKMAKQYDTIPLLAISALSPSGEINTEFLYELLLDNELQEKLINEVLHILRYKGYMGANLIISNITHYNQSIMWYKMSRHFFKKIKLGQRTSSSISCKGLYHSFPLITPLLMDKSYIKDLPPQVVLRILEISFIHKYP